MSTSLRLSALPPQQAAELARLIESCRRSCLWFLRPDYIPQTAEEAIRVLDAIARHGDREAFQRSMALRRWFSPNSSAPSAAAYRFFPLVRHDVLGLALHPFDLATNKVLALVGRLEVRAWIDLLECMDRVQGLGYLAWAACGKDPAFGPAAILEEAARSSRYTQGEVSALAFAGQPPDAGELSRRWHRGLAEARRIVALLPSEEAGCCVLGEDGRLYRGDVEALAGDLGEGKLRFHSGRIRGAFPSPADLA